MKAHLPNWVEQLIPEGMTVHNCIVIRNQHNAVVATFDTYQQFLEFMEAMSKESMKELFK